MKSKGKFNSVILNEKNWEYRIFLKFTFYDYKQHKYLDFANNEVKYEDYQNEKSEFGWIITPLKSNSKIFYVINYKTLREINNQVEFKIKNLNYVVTRKNIYLKTQNRNNNQNILIPLFIQDYISQKKKKIFWYTTFYDEKNGFYYDKNNKPILLQAFDSKNKKFNFNESIYSWFISKDQLALNIENKSIVEQYYLNYPKIIDGLITIELYKKNLKDEIENFKEKLILFLQKENYHYQFHDDEMNFNLLNPKLHFHFIFSNIKSLSFLKLIQKIINFKDNLNFNFYFWHQEKNSNLFYKDLSLQFYNFWIINHKNYLENEKNLFLINNFIYKLFLYYKNNFNLIFSDYKEYNIEIKIIKNKSY